MAKLNGILIDVPEYENVVNTVREAVCNADYFDMLHNRPPPDINRINLIVFSVADHNNGNPEPLSVMRNQSREVTDNELNEEGVRELTVQFRPNSIQGIAERDLFVAYYRHSDPHNLEFVSAGIELGMIIT